MILSDSYRNSLAVAQNVNIINDVVYKKLLENCFAVLTGNPEIFGISTLYNSKPDVVKAFYAALLSASAQFARHNLSKEEIHQFLTGQCHLSSTKADLYLDSFEKHRRGIQVSLLNIGSCLPHVTDVKWKIDYIVKSNTVDQSDGPLFRICLITEEYDSETENKKLKNVNFTCTTQEMQDLVYKVKDAVRHCTFTHRIL